MTNIVTRGRDDEVKTILICVPTLSNAGAERFVTELACGINKKRYRVVVAITYRYDTETAFHRKLTTERIEVVDATASSYLKQVFLIRDIIRKYKPVIVHSNLSSVLYMLLPICISGIKTKHLLTVHSMGYRIFSGLRFKLIRFCFKHRLVVPVAICDTVKQSVMDSYSLKESAVECVYNGVDTNRFTKTHKQERSDYLTFVSVGTLYPIKNQQLLINAFALVIREYPIARLVLVGDGELRDELQKLVEKLGLMASVNFVGNQSDVLPYLNEADVYCASSVVEGLPISVLEAMSCSLPIITTPAGGVVDIVKDGINGYITEQNHEDYSKKMVALIRNRDMRMSMSQKSREMSLNYGIEKCASGYESLYEKYARKE